MFLGQLVGIFLTSQKGGPLQACQQAESLTDGGLAGDRYCRRDGKGKPDQEITLIESEALEALARECDITLEPSQSRRNLLTKGVPLNHLVDREFAVGQVVLRGIRLCEPCAHLEELTQKAVKDGLRHRGGLRARIVKGGTIQVGDAIGPA